MEKDTKSKFIPFILTGVVIILDQVTKALVCKFIPLYTIGAQFFGDFLRIIHVRNPGVAFSFGAGWPDGLRRIAFSIIPIIVLCLVIGVYLRNKDFTRLQQWAICGVVGGGFGNIIDRIFRPAGVVDFIDIKFYGLFGLERWPTFNVADSAVVVCGILLAVSFLVLIIKEMIQARTARKNAEEKAE